MEKAFLVRIMKFSGFEVLSVGYIICNQDYLDNGFDLNYHVVCEITRNVQWSF